MRNWLLAFVFLNLAFFAYARLVGEHGATPPGAGPPAAVPRLYLVDEARDRAGRRCTSVGKFAERPLAERALALLAAPTRAPRLRGIEPSDTPLYTVSVTTPTLQPAIGLATRLRAAGVRDIELVPPGIGATQAVVSFGTYGDRDRAARRVAELRRLAVNATIAEQLHARSEWWVDVERDPGDAPIDAAAVGAALQAGAGLVAESCPEEAKDAPVGAAPVPGAGAAPDSAREATREGAPAAAPADVPADSGVSAPAVAAPPTATPAAKPTATHTPAPAAKGGTAKPAIRGSSTASTRRVPA